MSERNTEKVGMYDDGVRPLMTTCIHLRCKSMYYSETERPGLLHSSDVMAYWCDQTNQSIGCDCGGVSPEECQPGRNCHDE